MSFNDSTVLYINMLQMLKNFTTTLGFYNTLESKNIQVILSISGCIQILKVPIKIWGVQ